jgi:hypothetical protein
MSYRKGPRRQLTAAQQAASEERRQRMQAIAGKIAAMPEDARAALAAQCPIVTIEGRALSIHNACMVAVQCPNATIVGGFQQWRKAGRFVRKGEHGLAIWIPKLKTGDDAPADAESAERWFILGTVFDVSQTDAQDAPMEVAS